MSADPGARQKRPLNSKKSSLAKGNKLNLAAINKSKKNSIIQPKIDEELFDKDLAIIQMSTPDNSNNLNPLFMNTRQFNMTTVEHATAKMQQQYLNSQNVPAKRYGKQMGK